MALPLVEKLLKVTGPASIDPWRPLSGDPLPDFPFPEADDLGSGRFTQDDTCAYEIPGCDLVMPRPRANLALQ